jgi:hypothetical protein
MASDMRHMSNRDRIQRAAEEARLADAEKAAKKAAKPAAGARPKKAAKSERVKIVWELCGANGAALKTFPYPDKALAEAEAQSLSKSTGRAHMLRATKVPIE